MCLDHVLRQLFSHLILGGLCVFFSVCKFCIWAVKVSELSIKMPKYFYCETCSISAWLSVVMDGRSCVFEDFTSLKVISFVFAKESDLVLTYCVEHCRKLTAILWVLVGVKELSNTTCSVTCIKLIWCIMDVLREIINVNNKNKGPKTDHWGTP